jgi:hypothetical protein
MRRRRGNTFLSLSHSAALHDISFVLIDVGHRVRRHITKSVILQQGGFD